MNSFFGDFQMGLLVPVRGMGLILRNPAIRRKTLAPFVICILIFLMGVFFGLPALGHLIPLIATQGLFYLGVATGSWLYTGLYWLVFFLAWPAAIFFLLYLLFLVGRILATPFYSILAEATLVERRLLAPKPLSVSLWVKSNAHLLGVSVVKLLVFLGVGATLFIFSFFPGAGLLTGLGFLLLAAFDVVDLSLEAMQYGFRSRIRCFSKLFASFLGLAIAMGLAFLIPGLNFFLFPAAIVGASEFIEQIRARNIVMIR